MFAVRRTKFFFMVLVIVLNRLQGEVGGGRWGEGFGSSPS